MKRFTRALAVALPLVVAAILALPAAATERQALRIDMIGQLTGPDSAAGTWAATGAVNDAGTYTESFVLAGDTIKAQKVLTGSRGTIVLRVRALVEAIDACTLTFKEGSWHVAGGSGDYESLEGGGKPATEAGSFGNVCTGAIRVAHVGQAHIEERDD
jgi:hypothetical protein